MRTRRSTLAGCPAQHLRCDFLDSGNRTEPSNITERRLDSALIRRDPTGVRCVRKCPNDAIACGMQLRSLVFELLRQCEPEIYPAGRHRQRATFARLVHCAHGIGRPDCHVAEVRRGMDGDIFRRKVQCRIGCIDRAILAVDCDMRLHESISIRRILPARNKRIGIRQGPMVIRDHAPAYCRGNTGIVYGVRSRHD
jgi:hypothetical protein